MRWVLLLFSIPSLGLWAADSQRLDGGRQELAAGEIETPFVIGILGGELVAPQATTLTGPITLEPLSPKGPTLSVVAQSLHTITQDDWRGTQTISGTRVDATINITANAFGTSAERTAWGISGSNTDWNDFSCQWDGWLHVFAKDVDLATSSDDGSRVWIDLDGNGLVGTKEWGSNGWGAKVAAGKEPPKKDAGNKDNVKPRAVHQHLSPGIYRMRVQYETSGGNNQMTLWWNDATHGPGMKKGWAAVPAEGFAPTANLTLSGAVTVRSALNGVGTVTLGDGVLLASVPHGPQLAINGKVALAADLDLRQTTVEITAGAALSLAGHALQLGVVRGSGSIQLDGGRLDLAPGATTLNVLGSGTLSVTGSATLTQLADTVDVTHGTVRAANRCVAHLPLAAPLTTIIPISDTAGGPQEIVARITVPADAPPGLGIGAWRADRSGLWFQSVRREPLTVGTQTIHLRLDHDTLMAAEGHGSTWSGSTAIDTDHIGIFFYAEVPSAVEMLVDAQSHALTAMPAENALTQLRLDRFDGVVSHASTGKRWSLSVTPQPYPSEPFDPAAYALDLVVVQPDGSIVKLAGFHDQPVQSIDRGDIETFTPAGAPSFQVRFRPTQPGRHRLRLTAVRAGAATTAIDLPDLDVDGTPWDGIVHVDAGDPRFFSAGGTFVWPNGCNLNSTYDVRSRSALQTKLTPDRGSYTRGAYLERLAAAGGTGCETWLSPWNMGLEWTPRWPGFRGTGRYHDGHAWALDQFLDRAEALGVRVNVCIFNHGMGRSGPSPEEDWKYHPYFRDNGGWLDKPEGLFNDARAFTHQQTLFRYLGARYGDSPAILGWKLWAEVNLTHAPNPDKVSWHDRAAQALNARDPYHHPITTHWSGTWKTADLAIAAFPSISYLTIDAYHGNEIAIADLLNQSTNDPLSKTPGLLSVGKPIWVAEFGGSSGGCSQERMRAEHAIGPWVGFVSGHAGSPMLWWFEWIDQQDRYGVYGALAKFTQGEDLRGKEAHCIAPTLTPAATLWCRAWSRPGRVLGYLLDRAWGMAGGDGTRIADAVIHVGDLTAPSMHLEWWDPDTGTCLTGSDVTPENQSLDLKPPAFSRHLAFKLWANK